MKKPNDTKPKERYSYKGGKKGAKQKYLQESDDDQDEYSFYRMCDSKEKPLITTLVINWVNVPMEVDTGASNTVLSEETCRNIQSSLKNTRLKLRTYKGESIPIVNLMSRIKTVRPSNW